tara:strand:+ start:662 stop:877 length:216 start_codon:yes stop_codon:yes gene_type:complete
MTESKIQELEKRIEALEKEKNTKKARPKREPSGYALFVKEQMPMIIKEYPSLNQKERMSKCGELWRQQKTA